MQVVASAHRKEEEGSERKECEADGARWRRVEQALLGDADDCWQWLLLDLQGVQHGKQVTNKVKAKIELKVSCYTSEAGERSHH